MEFRSGLWSEDKPIKRVQLWIVLAVAFGAPLNVLAAARISIPYSTELRSPGSVENIQVVNVTINNDTILTLAARNEDLATVSHMNMGCCLTAGQQQLGCHNVSTGIKLAISEIPRKQDIERERSKIGIYDNISKLESLENRINQNKNDTEFFPRLNPVIGFFSAAVSFLFAVIMVNYGADRPNAGIILAAFLPLLFAFWLFACSAHSLSP